MSEHAQDKRYIRITFGEGEDENMIWMAGPRKLQLPAGCAAISGSATKVAARKRPTTTSRCLLLSGTATISCAEASLWIPRC